ncbi:MAG: 1-deoxy-D-xylulose-5-phosphate reductoisomerase [Nitriliruptoraceae bacterium]
MSRRRIVLLGASGSIGRQAVEVVSAHPERFELVGLAVGRDVDRAASQAVAHGVGVVAVADRQAARRLRDLAPDLEVLDGPEAATTLASREADLVLNAITGAIGLAPTLAALGAGTPVALANKESLIVGGPLVVAAAERAGGREAALIPVDSEHSALAQCLRGGRRGEVDRLVLTASGGPFRGRPRSQLGSVTPAEALQHPTWSMGPVITVNSATLVNKGLEVLEAHLLFDVALDRLDVVVHPQSVVHAMVTFRDGSTIAQLSPPDMRLPIQLALGWPERLEGAFATCDWSTATELTFEPVDHDAFPALGLAVAAGRRGGTHPATFNAANEVAVEAFLAGRLSYLDIAAVIEATLAASEAIVPRDLDDVLEADRQARARAAAELAAGAHR